MGGGRHAFGAAHQVSPVAIGNAALIDGGFADVLRVWVQLCACDVLPHAVTVGKDDRPPVTR